MDISLVDTGNIYCWDTGLPTAYDEFHLMSVVGDMLQENLYDTLDLDSSVGNIIHYITLQAVC